MNARVCSTVLEGVFLKAVVRYFAAKKTECDVNRKNQIKSKSKFERIKECVGFFRDLGVIIGLPFLILIGTNLYGKQIDALKAENDSLKAKNDSIQSQADVYKQTQYPQALSIIDSQRMLFEKER